MDKITNFQQDLLSLRLPDTSILNNCSILVTGATGLIGSAIVELLILRTSKIVVYAGCRSKEKFDERFKQYLPNVNLRFFFIDVISPIDSKLSFDYIIHAASNASPSIYVTDPVGTMKGNIHGVVNLLDYGIQHGLRKFLYISSGEIYGEGCQNRWHETDSGYMDTMAIRSAYPSSKRASETLCVAYATQYKIETCVARLCHIYGPCFTKNDNRAYAQFISNVLAGNDIVMKSTGEQYRSWLYVADCAAALLYILIYGTSQTAYNIADEMSEVTIAQFARTIAQITGKQIIFDIPSENEVKGSTPIVRAIFDSQRILSLGWRPQFNLFTGLEHTINSLMNGQK